ncbi:hypothetical protein DERP_002260 [Dermatophagoides pteronyssinus]|uniref:Uncharacterized protein n=1 Tax=Dermatophagoides pteronyssinus TaxID=6956 RepID=A0ABQ8JH76_DERPT|nr:hypothetical protein DERP_002260 [Dermatophagoides pteronyssinus]
MIDTQRIYHHHHHHQCGCGIELLKHAAISIEKKNLSDQSPKEIMMTKNNGDRIIDGLFWLKNAAIFMINYGRIESDSNDCLFRSSSQSIASEVEIDDPDHQKFDDSMPKYYDVCVESINKDEKLSVSTNSIQSNFVDCSHKSTVNSLYNDHAYAKSHCFKCNHRRERKISSKQIRFQTLLKTKWKQNQRQQ